jgi:hypothetical protein
MTLWYFRTHNDGYRLMSDKPSRAMMDGRQVTVQSPFEMHIGYRRPKGFPKLAPGEFRPVEVEGR